LLRATTISLCAWRDDIILPNGTRVAKCPVVTDWYSTTTSFFCKPNARFKKTDMKKVLFYSWKRRWAVLACLLSCHCHSSLNSRHDNFSAHCNCCRTQIATRARSCNRVAASVSDKSTWAGSAAGIRQPATPMSNRNRQTATFLDLSFLRDVYTNRYLRGKKFLSVDFVFAVLCC
jgi:hypothetical protein